MADYMLMNGTLNIIVITGKYEVMKWNTCGEVFWCSTGYWKGRYGPVMNGCSVPRIV